jgi:hypothetical protein
MPWRSWESELYCRSKSAVKTRVMYIESKATGLARIGRVSFSKTGQTLYYGGKTFQGLKGMADMHSKRRTARRENYFDVETGEQYWISGPRKDGADHLHGEARSVEIDPDVAEEYWTGIRGQPNA